MRQRDHGDPSKSHSNLTWLHFCTLISAPSQVGKKQKCKNWLNALFLFSENPWALRGQEVHCREKDQIGSRVIFCWDGNVETPGKKQLFRDVKEREYYFYNVFKLFLNYFYTLFYCTSVYGTLTMLCVLQIEGLWQPWVKKVHWCHFSNRLRW